MMKDHMKLIFAVLVVAIMGLPVFSMDGKSSNWEERERLMKAREAESLFNHQKKETGEFLQTLVDHMRKLEGFSSLFTPAMNDELHTMISQSLTTVDNATNLFSGYGSLDLSDIVQRLAENSKMRTPLMTGGPFPCESFENPRGVPYDKEHFQAFNCRGGGNFYICSHVFPNFRSDQAIPAALTAQRDDSVEIPLKVLRGQFAKDRPLHEKHVWVPAGKDTTKLVRSDYITTHNVQNCSYSYQAIQLVLGWKPYEFKESE